MEEAVNRRDLVILIGTVLAVGGCDILDEDGDDNNNDDGAMGRGDGT